MNQTWDYAELSRSAKQYGGPEKLINKFVKTGRWQMVPFVGIAFVSGVVAPKVISYLSDKRKTSKKEFEATKKELVQGINEYDAEELTRQHK